MQINPRAVVCRESVKTIVPMLAEREIPVTQQGSQAFVQYNPRDHSIMRVNLPCVADDASDDLIDAIQGFLDHEVGHILVSDPELIPVAKKEGIGHLCNIVEDTFVERAMSAKFRGSEANLERTREFFLKDFVDPKFKESVAAGKNPINFLLVPMVRAMAGQQLFINYLKDKGEYIDKYVEAAGPDMPDLIKAVKCSQDSLDVARLLKKRLDTPRPPKPAAPPPPPSKPVEPEKSEDQQQEQGPGQPQQSDGEGEQGEGEPQDAGDDMHLDGNDEEPSTSPAPEPKKDEGEEEQPGGGEPQDAGDQPQGGEDQPQDEEGGGQPGDTGEDGEQPGQDGSGGASEDPAVDDEGEAAGGAGGDSGENEPQPEPDQDGGQPGGASDDLNLNDTPDEPEADPGDAGGAGGGESGEDKGDQPEAKGESPGGGHENPTEPPVGEDIDPSEVPDFEGALSEMISDAAKDAASVSDYRIFTNDEDKVEPLPLRAREYNVAELQESVDHMIAPLQKDMERAVAARSQALWTGGHRSGRLHNASLARLRFNDERVFRRKRVNVTKDVAVTLLLDISGSMYGEKLELSCQVAYGLSSVLDRMRINHEVLSFSTEDLSREAIKRLRDDMNTSGIVWDRWEALNMPIIKEFNDRMDVTIRKRFIELSENPRHCQNNVDGECVQIAAKRLLSRPETRKILLVLSDGWPSCECPDRGRLNSHLKSVVNGLTARYRELDIVGLGIMDEAVKHFYPKHVVLKNLEDLPGTVMKQIKELLLK